MTCQLSYIVNKQESLLSAEISDDWFLIEINDELIVNFCQLVIIFNR